jgi:glycosyltransferase involved in cell wall biosynthesis
MKLLFLSHEIPSPINSETLPLYYLIPLLSTLYGHDITIISFASQFARDEDLEHLREVCSVENPIRIHKSAQKKLLSFTAVKNSILNLPKNLRLKLFVNLLDYYYDRRMDVAISQAIDKKNFDIIFSTRQMASYVVEAATPKIVQPFDAAHEWHRQVFVKSRGLKKISYGVQYALTRLYEKRIYEKFDACLVVTQLDKALLESLNPRIQCRVIPNGVDVDYFSPGDRNEESACLIFVSSMHEPTAVAHVLDFYNEIFPLILRENPDVKLYLVGRDPSKEIISLSADPLVSVTGYVTDVRPYVAKSTVFIAPEVLGTGMKNKVLQAMSMGKAVVTTTTGARGIAVNNKEHLVIADNFNEFAREIVSLLNDQNLRHRLGENARRLMEVRYSWEIVTNTLNEVLLNVLRARE